MSSAPPPHHSKPSSARHHSNHHQQNHTAKHHHEQRYIPKSTTPTPTPTSSAPKPSPPPPLTTALRTSTVAGGVSGGGGVVDGFVAYLPHDEAVAAGLGGLDAGESQAVVDLLNDSLAVLLRAKPREFWRQVAQNTSLHEFLDSYLQFRHRWYDLPHRGPKGTFAGLVVGELELCRRVFMVLYRISSNKDPGASRGDALSMMEHATLLQEIKLLDLPKLLDICAIYGHDNGKLASSLVTNAIIVQPKVLDGINDVIFHFLSILHTMHDRCMSSLQLLTSSGPNDQGYSQLHKDLLEVLDFVNDAIVTLDAFADAYQPAALLFCASFEMSYGVEELLTTLARLHDSLLPSLLQGFKVMSNSVFGNGEASSVFGNGEASSDNRFSDIVLGIRMLSKRTVRFGWRLLDFCYLNDQLKEHDVQASTKMLPAKVEDPMIRGDILVQTLKDINREATYTFHDNPGNTFLQALENEFQLMGRIGDLRRKGWVYIDDEQFQYMSQLTGSTLLSSWNNKPNLIISSHGGEQKQKDEEAAIVESKISQIRDLFPDYGKGFLAACLEAYNQNPEEVIQRILDGTLHEDLLALDASLEQVPQKKPAPVSGKDKGKGILVEPVPHIMNKPPKVDIEMDRVVGDGPSSSISLASQGLSSVSAAPQGRFTRKTNNDLPYSATFDSQNAKDAVRSAVLESQYEYEDEYDDSFDDLGFSVVESSYEETEGSNDAEASSHGPGPRWNSQKKPQFYVKDGKNYSYKVAGSVAVYSTREAAIVRQTQKGTIHGLGRGGNVPIGGFNRQQIDMEGDEEDETPNATENFGRGGNSRGRAGRRGGRNPGNPPEENANPNSAQGLGRGGRRGGRSPGNPPEENENTNSAQGFGRGGRRGGWDHDHAPEDDNEDPDVAQGFARGGPTPRGGGGSRGGRNHNRRDRAMKRHLQGMTGL